MGDEDAFESQMKGLVSDVKEYEKASRPPPPVAKTNDLKANVRAVVTLRTTEEATRLANELETFIQSAVDVFYRIDKESNAKQNFLANLHNMIALFGTFPPICLDEIDKGAAQKYVDSMRESQRNIERLIAPHGVGTKLVNSDEGRRMAIEIRSILDKIIGIGKIMENFQRKLLLLACKKATDASVLMKHTIYTNQLDEKCRLYNMHIDNLLNLTRNRMNMLDNMKIEQRHKQKMWVACEEITRHRTSLEQNTRNAVTFSDKGAEQQQHAAADAMLNAIQSIQDAVDVSVTRPTGDFDHTVSIQHQLERLADAVKNRQGADAARAAQTILNDLDNMKNPTVVPSEEDTDDPATRQALIDAADRLKDLLKGLLGNARNAISNPTPQTDKDFNDQLQKYKSDVKSLPRSNPPHNAPPRDRSYPPHESPPYKPQPFPAERDSPQPSSPRGHNPPPSSYEPSHPAPAKREPPAAEPYPRRDYDTIDTELAKSGMISAAAKAAEELAAIFQL